MRVFVKENTLWKPLCVSNTSFVDTDEFMKEMHRFVLANGTVNNVYIVFENTKVPVSHVNEIRVVAQLASAYHNTVLESALKGEKDLYGNSYTPNVWPAPQLVRPDTAQTATEVPGKKNHKTKSSLSNRQRKENEKGEYWDEELKGDRRVYDASFEMNEDLVPWKTDKDWEEKYGLYT
jgi:hypothetical protein